VGVFDEWLDARDGESMRSAWAALAPTTHEVAELGSGWSVTAHAAAQLAHAFLGWPLDRLDWLCRPLDEVRELAHRTFSAERDVTFSFLDNAFSVREACHETLTIYEDTDGPRGVQHILGGFDIPGATGWDAGGGAVVVRIFDREKQIGASVITSTRYVSTIGDIDLARLELFTKNDMFRVPKPRDSLAFVRGVIAQLGAEIDAHYDVSTEWPGRVVRDFPITTDGMHLVQHRFEAQGRAVTVSEQTYPDGRDVVRAELEGLPWGHDLWVSIDTRPEGSRGQICMRMPIELGKRVFARLDTIPNVDRS